MKNWNMSSPKEVLLGEEALQRAEQLSASPGQSLESLVESLVEAEFERLVLAPARGDGPGRGPGAQR